MHASTQVIESPNTYSNLAVKVLHVTSCADTGGMPLQDIEGDCTRLLETGLFARVRPRTQLPIGTQGPSYIRDRDGHLNPVVPLNQVKHAATSSHNGCRHCALVYCCGCQSACLALTSRC